MGSHETKEQDASTASTHGLSEIATESTAATSKKVAADAGLQEVKTKVKRKKLHRSNTVATDAKLTRKNQTSKWNLLRGKRVDKFGLQRMLLVLKEKQLREEEEQTFPGLEDMSQPQRIRHMLRVLDAEATKKLANDMETEAIATSKTTDDVDQELQRIMATQVRSINMQAESKEAQEPTTLHCERILKMTDDKLVEFIEMDKVCSKEQKEEERRLSKCQMYPQSMRLSCRRGKSMGRADRVVSNKAHARVKHQQLMDECKLQPHSLSSVSLVPSPTHTCNGHGHGHGNGYDLERGCGITSLPVL